MLEPDVVDLLESGCGLLIGLVTPDGKPFATRGWGLTVLDDGARARVLLGAEELARLGYPPGDEISTMIATTGCSVLTLRSIQLKGPVRLSRPANDVDLELMERYCDAFFDDVAVVDSIPRRLLQRLVPAEVHACEFDVVEVYNQTPGPNAGAAVAASTR